MKSYLPIHTGTLQPTIGSTMKKISLLVWNRLIFALFQFPCPNINLYLIKDKWEIPKNCLFSILVSLIQSLAEFFCRDSEMMSSVPIRKWCPLSRSGNDVLCPDQEIHNLKSAVWSTKQCSDQLDLTAVFNSWNSRLTCTAALASCWPICLTCPENLAMYN